MMRLPPFSEFVESLGDDFSERTTSKAVAPLDGEHNLLTPDGLQKYTVGVISASNTLCVRLLAAYHEWLSQQFDLQE